MRIKLLITDEAKWVAYGPCRVVQVFGNNNHTADNYIQFHEKPLAGLAAADVPAVASLYAPANAPFDFKFSDPIFLSELTIAVSSTNVNYTALTNQGVDATVIVETDFPVASTTTVVGDLTTSVDHLQVWANSAGPKRLLRVDIKNNAASTQYGFVYPNDDVADNEAATNYSSGPLKVLTTETKSFFFGRQGLTPQGLKDGVVRKGCTIEVGDADFRNFQISADYNIRAIYDV